MTTPVVSAPRLASQTGESGALLEVRDLRVHFPVRRGFIFPRAAGAVKAVDGVSLSIAEGETLGLVGESGSGKTTIGRAVIGLTAPSSGEILFEGADISRL